MDVAGEIAAALKTKEEGLIRKSASILNDLIDPAFVYVNSRGVKSDKQAYIDRICQATDWSFGGQKVEGLDVRHFGSFVVAAMTLHDTFIHAGGTAERTYQSLCVFRKEGSRWIWVAGQTMAPETGPRG